jgi:alpha-ketoglutarate-dependent taurine dioxygenase
MDERLRPEAKLPAPGQFKRKTLSFSQEELVKAGYLHDAQRLPLVIRPAGEGISLAAWAEDSREYIGRELLGHGAILFRDFMIDSPARFEQFVRAVSPGILDYNERSSPRSEISRGVYTSTNHPPDQHIHLHNEQSYARSWPMKLWFFCLQPPAAGGRTPIADGRRVLSLIDPKIRERFAEKRVLYVRNYGDGFGLSWQIAFQTESKAEVEDYCRRAGIAFEWKGNDRLRTRQLFDAVETHPATGEKVWFEHAVFFHVSSIEPNVRAALLAEFKEEDLPSNTYYGDGSPIEPSVLDEVREAYRAATVSFPWRERDVLLIDNMLVSHGREPYSGPRQILVIMSELHARANN